MENISPTITRNHVPVLHIGSWEQLSEAAGNIRRKVFVDEQHVPLELEFDEFDTVSTHVLASLTDGQAIATGRLLPDGSIGRMAVLADYRGIGLGAQMLIALMQEARQKGFSEVQLSAQTHAIGFYEKYGFVAEGDIYLDAGITHRLMRCQLGS